MNRGYVYILSNPSMPGLVKIGRTTRSVEQRANELWQTGVPTPFVVEEEFYTPDCVALEAVAHGHLEGKRVSTSREFFKVPVNYAGNLLRSSLHNQISEFVAEFDECLVVANEITHVCEGFLMHLADGADVEYYEIAQIIECLQAEDLGPAIERYKERCAARSKRRSEGLGLGSLDPSDIEAEIAARDIAAEPTTTTGGRANGPH